MTGQYAATLAKLQKSVIRHPGFLLANIARERKLGVRQLAQAVGMSAPFISDILRGNRNISPRVAMAVGELFDADPLYWLELQSLYDVWLHVQQQLPKEVRYAIEHNPYTFAADGRPWPLTVYDSDRLGGLGSLVGQRTADNPGDHVGPDGSSQDDAEPEQPSPATDGSGLRRSPVPPSGHRDRIKVDRLQRTVANKIGPIGHERLPFLAAVVAFSDAAEHNRQTMNEWLEVSKEFTEYEWLNIYFERIGRGDSRFGNLQELFVKATTDEQREALRKRADDADEIGMAEQAEFIAGVGIYTHCKLGGKYAPVPGTVRPSDPPNLAGHETVPALSIDIGRSVEKGE